MTTTTTPSSHPVPWPAVWLVVMAGVVSAFQLGKAAISAPMLQADLGLDLAALGWLTGIFAVVGVAGGLPAGAWTARVGARRMLLAGLVTTAVGAVWGATATAYGPLLLSRLVEGAGFLLVTIAAPALLERLSPTTRRHMVLALWSSFMPMGMALVLLAGPWFDDWRALWWAGAAATLIIAATVLAGVTAPDGGHQPARSTPTTDMIDTLRSRAALRLAGGFALYSLMFFALFSFLPVLLMERMQVTHQVAGWLSALAVAANLVGNLAAGALLSRGARRAALLAGASLTMAAASVLIFLSLLPDTATFMACVVYSAIGGMIPATLLSSASSAAPRPALVPLVVSGMMQSNNLGQLIGPVVVGGAIQRWDWWAAGVVVAVAGVAAAVLVRRSPDQQDG